MADVQANNFIPWPIKDKNKAVINMIFFSLIILFTNTEGNNVVSLCKIMKYFVYCKI